MYLTTVPPSAGKRKIVETCWGINAYPRLVKEGRVDYAFRVKLPASRVHQGQKTREVYLYQGKLVLKDCDDWDESKVPDEH